MDTKTYDNITVRKEKDSVTLISPETHIVMKRSTWGAIVADNVKSVMKPNDELDNVTTTYDSITGKSS